jgi:organic hydroperoxide reductase OsmC/OhrA
MRLRPSSVPASRSRPAAPRTARPFRARVDDERVDARLDGPEAGGGPMQHRYGAKIAWQRDGAVFVDRRYSRGHRWEFDGGAVVPASSSPQVVPVPMSIPQHVDPEEALVAAAASCHMLWFLSLAAARRFVVERYEDEAYGVMEPAERGRLAFTRIVLRPSIEFAGDRRPTPAELAALHEAAHDECYVANSLRATVVVESPPHPPSAVAAYTAGGGNTPARRTQGAVRMSKGMDRKKEQKKKPAKTLEEKRAAKKEKRQGR